MNRSDLVELRNSFSTVEEGLTALFRARRTGERFVGTASNVVATSVVEGMGEMANGVAHAGISVCAAVLS